MVPVPLTKKGEKIKRAMIKEYGVAKGRRVFYASENSGKITGVRTGRRSGPKPGHHTHSGPKKRKGRR